MKWRTQFDIYLVALQNDGMQMGPIRRLTLDEHTDLMPRWAPDSRSVYFISTRDNRATTYRQGIDERLAAPLLEGTIETQMAAISSDGAWIVYVPVNMPAVHPAVP